MSCLMKILFTYMITSWPKFTGLGLTQSDFAISLVIFHPEHISIIVIQLSYIVAVAMLVLKIG